MFQIKKKEEEFFFNVGKNFSKTHERTKEKKKKLNINNCISHDYPL